MQVTSSTSSQALAGNTRVNASAPKAGSNDANAQPEPSTKVTLSNEGLQKSAQASASDAGQSSTSNPNTNTQGTDTQDASTSSADASGSTDANTSSTSSTSTDPAAAPSALKSVTYGVLGLPDPSKPPVTNTAFGLGKCFAAVGTVVSTIMLALKFL
ncbi:conserved hypothetical protein [Paraburkholderia tropica]|uniref:hypothetical protein n=1 Tax=Paraburkholderia tropica TaxID=92647 RepID=UPI001CAC8107|nr:hypothetical protein [Paraburkholderia tropica]CAG9199909.1 conserved hypothetical protein [Paraburkholderia tropica]